MSTVSRRAALAASALVAAAPSAAISVSPDAELIRNAEAFIAAELETKARTAYLADLRYDEMTEADRALNRSVNTGTRRYHERLDEISMAEPTTPEGLAAQATAMLLHFDKPYGDDECHAWNLAESVLRVLGKPMPEWAKYDDGPDDEPST